MTDSRMTALRDALARHDRRPDHTATMELVKAVRDAVGGSEADPFVMDGEHEKRQREAGIDLVIDQLCAVLGVDPANVSWDVPKKDEKADVAGVLANVLTVRFGDRWRMDATRVATGEFSPDVREEVALRLFMQENDILADDNPDYDHPRSSWERFKELHPETATRVHLSADRILEAVVPLGYPDDQRELIALCVFMHDNGTLNDEIPDFDSARDAWEHYQTLPSTVRGEEHRTAADRIMSALENARRQP